MDIDHPKNPESSEKMDKRASSHGSSLLCFPSHGLEARARNGDCQPRARIVDVNVELRRRAETAKHYTAPAPLSIVLNCTTHNTHNVVDWFMMILTIRRPTPTTASFTVSTASHSKSVAARVRRYALFSIRIIIGFCVATALSLEFCQFRSEKACPTLLLRLHAFAATSSFSLLIHHFITNAHWTLRLGIYGGLVWAILRRGYIEETLLVMRGLGVQTSTSSSSYLLTSSTRFIPTTSIQDILIHEAFKGFEVRFYMAIVVEGEGEVVVVFPSIMPRRQILEKVWRGAKACLHEPKS